MDRETEGNLGKEELFENSTYLFHFNQLVPYHHTKYKEKLKCYKQKYPNKQILCFGSKIESKHLICSETRTFFGKCVYATFVCLLYNVIMSDSKSCNINKRNMK